MPPASDPAPDAPGEPVVRIRGLTKRFRVQRGFKELILRPGERDLRTALDAVDLTVHPGEFFGLLGQNGAGKSTLFKILATLILPDEGEVSVAGIDVTRDPAAIRRLLVPVIPSERSLYWRVSARENLRLYAALHGLRGRQAVERVDEALQVVGLHDTGGKQVGLFSSGMKQRLLIGRALLGRPRVLLLDEPTRSLDPVSAREFRRFLRERVGRDRGTTVLLATHDHEEVTELCDRVGVLDQGRLLAVGPTEVLLAESVERSYEFWTPAGDHPQLESLVARAGGVMVSRRPAPAETEGWHRVRIRLPQGEEGAARLLTALVETGIPVSRFTRDDLSLADLLQRVSAHGRGGEDGREGKQ
ncbi:MAG: ABC transporter ATP-binding protein [Gemmatimonadales bacterium]|nr:MAG: ABC transporter ATP-binding protein [Gemmatimonadales bacterium]